MVLLVTTNACIELMGYKQAMTSAHPLEIRLDVVDERPVVPGTRVVQQRRFRGAAQVLGQVVAVDVLQQRRHVVARAHLRAESGIRVDEMPETMCSNVREGARAGYLGCRTAATSACYPEGTPVQSRLFVCL